MLAKLIVGGVELGFEQALPISTNLQIVDVREPEKRQAAFSKTITIPGTGEANKLFEFIFDVNTDLQTFNPNKAIDAYYEVRHLQPISGKLQLNRVVKRYNGETLEINYECNLIGTSGNLFLDISTLFLTDLDFSDLDHTLSYANFSAAPTSGIGYCYGYIDYGLAGMNGFNWNVEHMKAAIWEKEYVDRIFAAQGKTYTSTFFNSAYYSKIAIPDVNAGPYQLSGSQITNNEFYAGKTNTQTSGPVAGTVGAGLYTFLNTSGFNPVTFQDDSTPPFNDPGGVFSLVSSQFTSNVAGSNSVTGIINYDLEITKPAGLPTANQFIAATIQVGFDIYLNGNPVGYQQTQTFNNVTLPLVSGNMVLSTTFSITAISPTLPAGSVFQVVALSQFVTGFFANSGTPLTSGPASNMTYKVKPNSTFYSNVASSNQAFGNLIEMNSTIPQNVKQLDFLKSIIIAHNLYIEQDKEDPNNYIIEPRESFISYANALDWTKKQDLSREISILPMGELEGKRYIWTYKSDKDYFNSIYENRFKEIYGQKQYDVDNDFINVDKKFELIFSPTPGVSFQTNIVAPRLLSVSGAQPGTGGLTTVSPLKCNIRRLYWGGMKSCNLHNLKVSNISIIQVSQYPSLNHFDDANSPTVDLCFDAPREFYFTTPAQTWTNNNLYSFYSKWVDEVTDKNSSIVKTYMLLDERDIAAFSFSKIIFVDKQYYFVNKIQDYDPQVRKTVPVELLKLKRGQTFLPVNYDPNDPPPNQNQSRFIPAEYNQAGNYGLSSALSVGTDVRNFGENGIVSGSNVQVQYGVTNFDGIGMKDVNIGQERNNKTMIRNNGIMVGNSGVDTLNWTTELHDVSFTMSDEVQSYEVDATPGNIDVFLFSLSTSNKGEYVLVRVDDTANTVTVYGPGGELINTEGISLTNDPVPGFKTRRYRTNGTDYFY